MYGGNERTVMSGEFYFKYPSKATLLGDGDGDGQLKQTNDGINYARDVSGIDPPIHVNRDETNPRSSHTLAPIAQLDRATAF